MKELNVIGLAKKNIANKPARTYGMMVLTGILCFILFMSSFLILSLKNGMTSLSNRMGADIIVVPEGYDSKITGAILRGEPNSFFLDEAVTDRVRSIEGVEQASPQLFLATLSAGCCSFPIQIIGIDFEQDFIVSPWLEKQVKLPLKEGQVVVGNNIVGDYQSNVRFFNQPFEIQGRLAKTGMGFDNTVFMTMEETKRLAKEYEKILGHPISKQENLISSVMVKVKGGVNPKDVFKKLADEFKGEQIYPLLAKQMMTQVSDNMQSLLTYIYALIALLWILAFFILTLVYSISIKERKREFAMFRILGATKKKLKSICLAEILMINMTGAVFGSVFSFIISLLFGKALSLSFKMPFLSPNIIGLFSVLLFTILAGSLLGPLASIVALNKMEKQEMGLLLREND
ncbi:MULTISPECIES: ABC transporter permease [Peptoniphilus]|uniref:ABC transporter permease n=1 Tax=Peptoniphilus TaxID=162289 RepID=UPI0001DA9A91|nr:MULTISPECIES: ABC transporter permease [Peptoniphilus]EFI41963.1 efflux ABC transporter, permease protein [Peptoniphilus sp. oral taxon 386 str. F0131]